MNKNANNNETSDSEDRKGPSVEAFRKAKWVRQRRGLVNFFVFLCFISAILFFDYYWVLFQRVLKQPPRESEQAAGKFLKVSDAERRNTFDKTKQLLNTGRIEEARQTIMGYLQKESNAEGYYLAGLVYMRQGDLNNAYRNFKEAVRLQPDYYDAQQKLAEIYVTIGNLKSTR